MSQTDSGQYLNDAQGWALWDIAFRPPFFYNKQYF